MRTHCRNGHLYSEANTAMKGKWRRCRTCSREQVARWLRTTQGRDYTAMLNASGTRKKHLSKFYERKREWLNAKKTACSRCGATDKLQFHHRNPADKAFTIGHLSGHSIERTEAEIAKCDVLCSKCHRKLHDALRRRKKAA